MADMPEIDKMIFVFGSNESGIHGAGAAAFALKERGAVLSVGFGPQGQSFAIPTKNWMIRTLDKGIIAFYVDRFIYYAMLNPHLYFQVTRVGCGLAGFKDKDIAPLFDTAPSNCLFDFAWKNYFQLDYHKYWGHNE